MKRLGALPGQITDSAQEAINTDIFIELIPVQTRAAPADNKFCSRFC